MHLLDPQTLNAVDVTSQVYWRTPFEALASTPELVEFTVLDVEPSGPVKGKLVLADAQVAVNAAFRSSVSKPGAYEDDMDMDSPDIEMESDLLPVNHAEALDVLAQIDG